MLVPGRKILICALMLTCITLMASPASSSVLANQLDIGRPLSPLPAESTVAFWDLGTPGYDEGDPVYLNHFDYNDNSYQDEPENSADMMTGFSERLPHSGREIYSPGLSYALFTDGYKLFISDKLIDSRPRIVGKMRGLCVEVVHGLKADYYHVLGTWLIKIQPYKMAADGSRRDDIPAQELAISVIFNAFGSKVSDADWDLGKMLCGFEFRPESQPQVAYWDVGSIKNEFDPLDIAYIHMNPNINFIELNDIRLTKYGRYLPGSKVAANDNDIQRNLTGFPEGSKIVFVDLSGNRGYDLQDPVYYHINDNSSRIGRMDIRLSFFGNRAAGTLVDGIDPDRELPITELRSAIRFLNLNGNMRSDGKHYYDNEDAIYLDISVEKGAYGFVVVNDIRLSR